MPSSRCSRVSLVLAGLGLPAAVVAAQAPPAKPARPAAKPAAARPGAGAQAAPKAARVSFHRDVRPIFRARCEGCHQPAKPSGGYVMTAFDRLLAGGDSKQAAVVPGKPAASRLLALVTPKDGKAAMPPGGKALSEAELSAIRRWVTEGAVDDSPASARVRYDMDHPPVYTRPPVVTSLDYSPDGQLLAVAGFHEVLLLSPDGSRRVARLVGTSERIESVRFSPDGTRLAVTGGRPGRTGEVQVWDVAARKLLLSVPVTSDTLYGASWSSDGKLLAFGGADNTVRAIDAATGQQVVQQGSHTDWVLGTAFSADGSLLVSVGRDRTAKLTEVATQRFIDNLTSITPGALKGGLAAIARHPQRDEIVVGGDDGRPRVYRLNRLTTRVIGDDSNLIREMPALKGRLFSVAVSRDGRRIAAGSSLDGAGQVGVYSYEFNTELPKRIQEIQAKVVTSRTPEEHALVDEYHREGVKLIAKADVPEGGIYAVAFAPDGKSVAAAGADGRIRLVDAETGAVRASFVPVELSAPKAVAGSASGGAAAAEAAPSRETLPPGAQVTGLEVRPASISLGNRYAYSQLLVRARLTSGDVVEVTRMAQARLSAPVARVSPTGLVRPAADGAATLRLTVGGKSAAVPVSVSGVKAGYTVDYVRDVQPVLSRLGCNQGTCHGAAQGKAGFKLSLRGYDPIFDVRALTDDHAARRVNVASPDDSLMLLKPTGAVPHQGGQLLTPGDPYYQILRSWIASGATLSLQTPRVTRIVVQAENPVVPLVGGRQQMRVLATYADGKTRDVTREAFIETGNMEVATADRGGLMTALRRGEAPVLARFEGAYAATTLTVMGDRTGFVWQQPPSYGRIDELVAGKWKRMKIQPSGLCTDAEFIRRLTLDLTGLPPTADAVRAFLADPRESRAKREALVDQLVGNPDYVEYWTNKWADLLQVNRKFLGVEGSVAFRKWIRDQVEKNTPYDQFARAILTATGSNRENPAASYWKIVREPASAMENTTHLFLGVRFNCNKCHDHPFERWTQDQYYHLAAYFAQVDLKRDPASGNAQIGGSAVESGKPLYEIVADRPDGEITHERTGQVAPPQFPYTWGAPAPAAQTRRHALAEWLTSKDNQYFARSYVNRVWGYLFGVGIIEPIDDIRAGNPPTNPELLEHLTQEFIRDGFDVRALVKRICKSRTYQLSLATNRWNSDDRTNYSHAVARRLPAEVLYDAVHRATGALSRIPGLPPGTRAAMLPDSGVELESGFFGTFGRPARESACECERTSGLQLGPVMALISGPTIAGAIADPENEIAKLAARETDDRRLVNEIFLRILNRPATDREVRAFQDSLKAIAADDAKLQAALKQREAEVAPLRAKQEQEREAAIAAAKAELEAYQRELAPRTAAREKERADRIAAAEAELKRYQETVLPDRIAEFERRQGKRVAWSRLRPEQLANTTGATLETLADGSVFVTGPQAKGTYTVTVRTDLKNIRGIRLEVLPDERLPNRGPGRAPDGNFVLTELEVTAAPAGTPGARQKVSLVNPAADYTQAGFDIRQAVDGQAGGNGGWALSPVLGIPHWATFETEQPVGGDGGTLLTFTFHHQFGQGQFGLGRFRLSLTTEANPGLSPVDELAAALAVPAGSRDAAQQAELRRYVAATDAGAMERRQAVAEARRPLPPDPKLVELQEQITLASRPVPEDPKLLQLRADAAESARQSGNQRLTAAQDLAWALINSPSFLFNH